jgi:AraC family transcriptional regulator
MVKKNNTQAEYIRRINLSLTYINENLDQSLGLSDIASKSHFSEYHFHRIFHGIVGETVSGYVSRKRLERAANRLICEQDATVTDISERGGFSSSANFSKAFKQYFGISPSQLRNPLNNKDSKIGKIQSKYGKAFNPKDLYSQRITDVLVFDPDKLEEMLMNVKVEQVNEKKIAYLTAPKGYELDAIFETWDKITNWGREQGIRNVENKRFAICHDNPMMTPTEQCRYDATIEINDGVKVNAPYTESTIPGGKYAIAYYKGEGDKVSNFYMELYSAWLPNSGFEPDNFPPVAHYLNDSRVDGYVEMEVYIKVKTLSSS